MTAVAETAAARREFDRAMALLDDDAAAAWARFGAATAIDAARTENRKKGRRMRRTNALPRAGGRATCRCP